MDMMQKEYDDLYARLSEGERNTASGTERLQKINDMFWGHVIEIMVEADGEITTVGILG